jgi:hypothetical protein
MVTKEHMNELMKQLTAIFPGWKAAIKSTEDLNNIKSVWFDEIQKQELTVEDLEKGILTARQHSGDYLPSLGKFMAWCQSTKYPSVERAWQMACMGTIQPIKNHCVAEAARRTGQYDIINRPESHMKPLFMDHYREVVNEARGGAQFQLPKPQQEQKAIEKKEPTEADKLAQQEAIEQIMKLLGE